MAFFTPQKLAIFLIRCRVFGGKSCFFVFKLFGGGGKGFLFVYVLGMAGIQNGEGVATTIILRWMHGERGFHA